MIVQYFDLYFGIYLRTVGLAAFYFWFTPYNHEPVIR